MQSNSQRVRPGLSRNRAVIPFMQSVISFNRGGYEADESKHARRNGRRVGWVVWLAVCSAAIAAEPNAFLNLSARGRVDRGENILIGGLVVERTTNVLLRGVGPSLGRLGVNESLARP